MDDIESELRQTDRETFAARLARLREIDIWLNVPPETGYSFGQERETMMAFWDARFSYVNGYWIAAILSSLTAVEHHLAWRLTPAGSDKMGNMNARDVADSAVSMYFIDQDQADALSELRTYRDDYGRVGQNSNYERKSKAATEGEPGLKWGGGFDPNDLLSGDARKAVKLATTYFVKWAEIWDAEGRV